MTTVGATKGQVLWRGCVAALGVFAGLCAIFAFVETAVQAWQDHARAQWPEVIARVQKCAVVRYSYKLETFRIDCHITYPAGAEEVASEVYSLLTPAPRRVIGKHPAAQVEQMEDWIEKHPQGTPIIVHYDPADHTKAGLATTDMLLAGPRTSGNLKLLGFFAGACVLLLTIARITTLRSDAAVAIAKG